MDATSTPINKNAFPRQNIFIWIIRILQLFFAFVILGTVASKISPWHNVDCSTPSNITFAIVISIFTIPPVIYLLLTTGPFHTNGTFSFAATVTFDTVFLVLWLITAALGTYKCSMVCTACGSGVWKIGSLRCPCGSYRKRAKIGFGEEPFATTIEETIKTGVQEGIGSFELLFFAFTLLMTVYLQHKLKKARDVSGGTGAETGVAHAPVETK